MRLEEVVMSEAIEEAMIEAKDVTIEEAMIEEVVKIEEMIDREVREDRTARTEEIPTEAVEEIHIEDLAAEITTEEVIEEAIDRIDHRIDHRIEATVIKEADLMINTIEEKAAAAQGAPRII